MDFKVFDSTSIEAARPILQELTNRKDEHGTPSVVRGHHSELGWVIFIKDAGEAILIAENGIVAFVDH